MLKISSILHTFFIFFFFFLHRGPALKIVRQDQSGIDSGACFLVAKLCLTLCDPMDCSMPGFPVLHCLLEFAQTHWASLVLQMVKNPPALWETWV